MNRTLAVLLCAIAAPSLCPVHAEEPAPNPRAVHYGVDLYQGLSNIDGYRQYNDHMWSGYGGFVPSTGWVSYEHKNVSAKLAIGTGALFNSAGDEFYQPVEAWVKTTLGKSASITAGKFWVPLGRQEWEYESKPGVMVEAARGPWSLSAAATHNRALNTGNVYTRLGRVWGEKATVGLSVCGGRGLTFDSDHDRGIGLDASYNWCDWEFSTELLRFKAGSTGRFDFEFAKAAYHGWKKTTPYISRTMWNDSLGQQGVFRSTVIGLVREITPHLSIEPAYARISGVDKYFVEAHFSWSK